MRVCFKPSCVLVLSSLAIACTAIGQTPAPEPAAPQTEPPALTIGATLQLVLASNLRIKANATERKISREREKAEWAIFEPALLVTVAEESNRRQNNTEQFLSQRTTIFDENNRVYSAALESVVPTGGKVRVGSQVRKLDNNLQLTGSPEWESFTGVTLTQPLLRGAGWSAVAAQIKLAAKDSAVALQEYRRQLSLVLSAAEMAYWELTASQNLVALRRQSLATADRVLADNRQRVSAGKMTDLEVLQAEAGLAVRQANLAEAEQRVVEATAQLNSFLGRASDDRYRFAADGDITPTDLLAHNNALPYEAVVTAFGRHPAYLAQIGKMQQENIRLVFAQNQRWPQLDLRASYGLNGLGQDLNGTADAARTRDFESWYVGIDVRIPITGGMRERAQVRAAKLRYEQALLELKAIEIELINSVSSLAKKAASQGQRATALTGVVSLNERLLTSELERLDAGKSESRKVLESESELSDARINALASQLDHRRATVELLVQQGTYLEARGFELP